MMSRVYVMHLIDKMKKKEKKKTNYSPDLNFLLNKQNLKCVSIIQSKLSKV